GSTPWAPRVRHCKLPIKYEPEDFMHPIVTARHALCAAVVAVAAFAGSAQAAIKTQLVEYKQGDTTLEGYLAYDDAVQGKRPGVLVVHEWDGLGDYAKTAAEMLAQIGHVDVRAAHYRN